jgi:hypothetical protein
MGSTERRKDLYGVASTASQRLTAAHNGVVGTCSVTAEPTGHIREPTQKVLERMDSLLGKAGTNKIEARDRASMAGALRGF